MATGGLQMSGPALLDKLLKFREGELTGDVQGLPEQLEQICRFLQDHEVQSYNDCTHEVLLGYPDWWISQRSTKRLAIVENNTLDTLYRYISTMYEKGVPLTLGERRTTEFSLIQDIQLRGGKDEMIAYQDLIGTQNKFLRVIGQAMGELYPSFKESNANLDAFVFDGSGFESNAGVQQTLVRIVWPAIIVDKDRAGRIMDFMTNKLIRSEDPEISALETRMKGLHEGNKWGSIWDDAIYMRRESIRMPFNDNVSRPPMQKPEKRPFRPVGAFRFKWTDPTAADLDRIELIASGQDLTGEEWLKLACVRRDHGTPLTDWKAPSFTGEQRARGYTPSEPREGAPSRTGGQVRVRTEGGSPTGPGGGGGRGRGGPARFPGAERVSAIETIERSFIGNLEEFRSQVDAVLSEGGEIRVDGEVLTWTQHGESPARIEFRAHNRRVYIIGQANQTRSLLTAITGFVTHTSDGSGSSATGYASRAATQRASGASRAPSQAFAPAASLAGRSGPTSLARSTVSRPAAVGPRTSSQANEPYARVTAMVFAAETESELTLNMGDRITILQDDAEGSGHSIDRWVYGKNETTQEIGWFPLSYSKASEAGMEAVPE